MPQFVYTPPRQQKKFGNPKNIDFFVYGEIGIRLSDALEGKWNGFVGRDDRPLSEEDRAQIMLRLLVSSSITPTWTTAADSCSGRRVSALGIKGKVEDPALNSIS